MADNHIDIVFGAQVAALIAGVNSAKAEIESIRHSVESVTDAFGGLKKAIVEVFAIKEIAKFAEEMADLGKKTLDSAFILGQSVQDFTQLSGAMQLLGVDTDRAQRTIIFLSHSLQSAMTDATGKAAIGFKNLGISMAELRANSGNMTSLLLLIIEHIERLGLTARNAGALKDVLGRSLQELAPLLRSGSAEFKAALAAAEQYKDALTKAAPGMDETKKLIDKMLLSLKVLRIDGFGFLKSDIDEAIKEFDRLAQTFIAIIAWIERVGKALRDAGHALEGFINEVRGLGPSGYGDIPDKPLPKSSGDGPGTEKAGGKGGKGDDRLSIWRDELRQMLEAERNFLGDSKKEELEYWQAKLATVGTSTKQDLKLRREVNQEIFSLEKQLAKEAEQVAIEEQTYKQSSNDLELTRKKQQLDTDLALGRINERQNIQGQQQLIDEKMKADEEYYHAKESAAAGDTKKITELEQQEYLDHQKLTNEKLTLDNKLLEESHATWKQIGDSIASAVDRSVLGVIQGTNTMAKAFRDLGQSILSEFLNLALKKATSSLFDSAFDSFKSGSGLLGGIGKLFAAGGGLASLFGGAPGILDFEGGSLTSTVAGSGGILGLIKGIPLLGKLFSGGGVVPSARFGWQVPSFANGGIPSLLHGGEMVLPKNLSEGVQNAINGGGFGGGGITMNFHGPADGASIKRWVGDTLRQNPNYVSDLFRRNAITPAELVIGPLVEAVSITIDENGRGHRSRNRDPSYISSSAINRILTNPMVSVSNVSKRVNTRAFYTVMPFLRLFNWFWIVKGQAIICFHPLISDPIRRWLTRREPGSATDYPTIIKAYHID